MEEKVMAETREDILVRFRNKIGEGRPIIGGGAGTGISAKFEEAGGIRMSGHGSMAGLLPFGDANEIVMDMAREVLPVVKHTPVLAGVCGTDPMRKMERFLLEVKSAGFSGVQNFPTIGLFDGTVRVNFEETGFGYSKEVDMIRIARELDLLTTPYVFSEEEARQMARAGADIMVAHMGTTVAGAIGAKTTRSMEECADLIDRMAKAAMEVNDEVIVLCHGGPIAEPGDAARVFELCRNVHGFYGASSMERLPVERAIQEQTGRFVDLRLKRR